MLAFILTDAGADAALLRPMLARATDASFNRVTVDGDMSTYDSVFLLANGAYGVALKTAAEKARFEEALQNLCIDLSKKIAKDGEGASKFLEIRVEGARRESDAHRMAEVVATSPLVKTAAYGEDSNWGRILAAMGRSGVIFDPVARGYLFWSALRIQAGSAVQRVGRSRTRTFESQRSHDRASACIKARRKGCTGRAISPGSMSISMPATARKKRPGKSCTNVFGKPITTPPF